MTPSVPSGEMLNPCQRLGHWSCLPDSAWRWRQDLSELPTRRSRSYRKRLTSFRWMPAFPVAPSAGPAR
eukprot:2280392-Pleurochrysis_carterae.AAC.1